MTSELPGMGELKRAAIDAYMRGDGFTVLNDQYCAIKYQDNARLTIYVSRPGTTGTGGGHATGTIERPDPLGISHKKEYFSQGHAYSPSFVSVRDNIEQAFEPWPPLPNPTQVPTEENKYYSFLASVSLDPIIGNAKLVTDGDGKHHLESTGSHAADQIRNELAQLNLSITGLRGQGITSVSNGYLTRLEGTPLSIAAVAKARGSTIGIERGLAETDRCNINTIISEATKSFQKIAEGRNSAPQFIHDLIVAATPFAGTFFPSSKARDRIVQVSSFAVKEFMKTGGKPAKCHSYSNVISELSNGIFDLNAQYQDLEKQLSEYHQGLFHNMEVQHSNFYTQPAPSPLTPAENSDLVVNQYAMTELDVSLQTMYQELLQSISLAGDISIGTSWVRDARIGLRGNRPSHESNLVPDSLVTTLHDLAEDTDISRRGLTTWHKALKESDNKIKAEIEAIIREMEELNNLLSVKKPRQICPHTLNLTRYLPREPEVQNHPNARSRFCHLANFNPGLRTIDPRINNLVCQPVLELGSTPHMHDHFRATAQEDSNSNVQRYRHHSPGEDAHYCHAARQRRMATILLTLGISCTMFIVLSLPRTRDRDERAV